MQDVTAKDQWGQPVTAGGADAVQSLDRALMAYLGLARDTGDHLKATLAADPGMTMAHVLKGYFFLLMASGPLQARAPKSLAAAEAAAGKATRREQAHVHALGHWIAGDQSKAAAVWEEILADHPLDVLALRLAHHAYFYMGAAGDMLGSVERALKSWGEAAPGYGFVLGMRAFALEESGDYAAAEKSGRRAVDLNPDDPWAVHAVAHVCESQDHHADGIDWIKSLEPHWSQANNFRYHIWWHRALMHLDRGELDEAVRLYDECLWDPQSDEYLDLCNDAALLLRLEILGRDVGGRWQPLADKVAGRADERILAFIDCHFLAALASAGRLDAARAMAAGMRDKGGIFAAAGAPVGEAIIAWKAGDHRLAADLMEGARKKIVGMGGSHAQRDLFEMILIDAALKAGDAKRAKGLLAARTVAKPADPWSWRTYAGVLRDLGEDAAVAEARAASLAGS
jgi:tetratricopeptide (TPR) repeat protein